MISDDEMNKINYSNLNKRLIQIKNELSSTISVLNDITNITSKSLNINDSIAEEGNLKDLKIKTQRIISSINNTISAIQSKY
ncbi:MAG: hypothetical protein IJ572_03250 [Bacilli bacterium]|nr:hypothetical protein [Bacilli bacterium]